MPKKTIRVSVTLGRDVYDRIIRISHTLGIKPSQWISLAVTSTIKDVRLSLIENGGKSSGTCAPMLPEKMIALLGFVHAQEKLGKKPSHRDICIGLNVTRNTARKRIRYLAGRGFLAETKSGRKKLVELTQKGKKLF